ncbi:MAG: mannose-6-phosphate isomerase, class I [Treponema sp.]|jgi:mannose-6-phosphate isomerase|nr:mannose-6-phosphate isomerase, class I [Treponema sp.]
MSSVFKLNNTVKYYEWGSPEWIPRLLGLPNREGKPWAELWMGAHPQGPSALADPAAPRLLPELIGQDPPRYLGEETARDFGGLPFLFKVLAAERPLSIQAHPNLAQARSGWERENSLGVPVDAPRRNYRDPNHKPEIICALSPFTAMAGFREPGEIRSLLRLFGCPALDPLLDALDAPPGNADGALQRFLSALFSLSPERRLALGAHARGFLRDKPPGDYAGEWNLAARFAELYPEDPALIAPLYLNLITLQSGEAMNIPAGILHAYVRGFGVELMANSDNVLRGGLTPKHVDSEELTAILRFAPYKPEILKPAAVGALESYPSPFREFSLYRLRGRGAAVPFPLRGPAILLILEGELAVPAEKLLLKRGESAFVVPETLPVLSGGYEAAVAAVGAAYSAPLDATPAGR